MKKIKAITLSFAFLLLTFYTLSAYQDFSRSDGREWKTYNESSKLGFALGFITGAHAAIEKLDVFIRGSSYSEKKIEEILPIYNITNTQLKEALDKLYGDSANISIPIKDAALIVCEEVRGEDVKTIEKEKRLKRLPPEEQRLVKRADYLKDKIKRGEYPRYEVKKEGVVEKETGRPVPLETEDQIVDFWTEQILPEEAPEIKEAVKTDYALTIVVASCAAAAIALMLYSAKKRGGKTKKQR